MSESINTFRSLFQIDVSKHVEMKGSILVSVVAVCGGAVAPR